MKPTRMLLRPATLILLALLSSMATAGLRVAAVGNEGAARGADLRVGDEIMALIAPESVAGDALTFTDFRAFEARRSLSAVVEMRVRRAGRTRVVRVPQGLWELSVSPEVPTPLSAALATASALAAGEKWRELAEHCRQVSAQSWPDAELRILRRGCSELLERGGESGASAVYRAGAVELGRRASDDLSLAHDLAMYGTAVGKLQRIDEARALLTEARSLWRQAAPGAIGEVMADANLGILASIQGRSAEAEAIWNSVLTRYRAMHALPSLEASVLNNLFVAVRRRGDLANAQQLLERAIKLKEATDPGSQSLARSYSNLALLARERGDLAAAEQSLSATLNIRKRLDPESLDTQRTLGNLANLALDRGDVDTAADLHASTLAVFRRTVPGSATLAENLRNLAAARVAQGRLREASELLAEALAIEVRAPSPTLALARTRLALGTLAEKTGELTQAAGNYDDALAIQQKLAAEGLGASETLLRRGLLRLRLGNAPTATGDLEHAVRIRARLSPGSLLEAEARLALARALEKLGRPDDSLAQLRLAATAVEEQFEHAGASVEGQLGLGQRAAPIYRALIATLAEKDRTAEAFAASERYRAQLLRRLLEERDLDLPERWPAELRQRRSQLNAQYEQLQAQIGRLPPQDPALTDKLGQLAKLRTERMTLAVRMRGALPAPIATPDPAFELSAAATRLRPNEAMLSFILGDEGSYLFLLRAGSEGIRLRVHRIAANRETIGAQVDQWRTLMRAAPGVGGARRLAALGAELRRTLLGSVESDLIGVRQLAVLPDGALWQLPFAALVSGGTDEAPRYLIEQFTLSHELAWSLREPGATASQSRRPLMLAAFGDPVLAPELAARFPPLPATRDELNALRSLFGAESAIRLGKLATESELLRLAPTTRYLHIASHAVARPALPLDSAILLSGEAQAVDRPDNSLRAFEIVERLRFDAELVTLSACDSGSGAELGGEGLVGLTWAFRFAGAKAVLASLWPVGDRSTAAFMTDFYARLATGASKDEALRSAQLAALQRGRGSARGAALQPAALPFHWAAFELFGQP